MLETGILTLLFMIIAVVFAVESLAIRSRIAYISPSKMVINSMRSDYRRKLK